MSSDNLPTCLDEDMKYFACKIRMEYSNDEEKALDYARLVTQGSSKMQAFCAINGINWDRMIKHKPSYNRLNAKLWRYIGTDIVVESINRVQLSLHSYFHDKHLKALNEQFNLGMNARSEKVRSDALNQFIQNTRNPLLGKPTDNEVKLMSESRQLLDSISNAFQQVSSKNISNRDNAIDVDVENPPLVTAGEENSQRTIFTNFSKLDTNTKDSL